MRIPYHFEFGSRTIRRIATPIPPPPSTTMMCLPVYHNLANDIINMNSGSSQVQPPYRRQQGSEDCMQRHTAARILECCVEFRLVRMR
ncbi:hypothetical protein KC349_g5 [Hortaea werneckii]|nr:hypothetical protein KC349_g5 [Hortaea werneckii]